MSILRELIINLDAEILGELEEVRKGPLSDLGRGYTLTYQNYSIVIILVNQLVFLPSINRSSGEPITFEEENIAQHVLETLMKYADNSKGIMISLYTNKSIWVRQTAIRMGFEKDGKGGLLYFGGMEDDK